MTEVEHALIKAKIETILKANAALFDVDDESKLVLIQVGIPNGEPIPIPDQMPAAWITAARGLETITRIGSHIGTSPKGTGGLRHIIHYFITIMVNSDDSQNAEAELDKHQKLLLETLEADSLLTAGSNARVNDSYPIRVETINQQLEGTPVRSRTITYECIVTTN